MFEVTPEAPLGASKNFDEPFVGPEAEQAAAPRITTAARRARRAGVWGRLRPHRDGKSLALMTTQALPRAKARPAGGQRPRPGVSSTSRQGRSAAPPRSPAGRARE